MYAHLVNTVMTQCPPQDDGPSDALDVDDLIKKEADKEAAQSKGPKGAAKSSSSTPGSRSKVVSEMLEKFISQILNNEILKETGGNF